MPQVVGASGILDPSFGRNLPRLLSEAGLSDVRADATFEIVDGLFEDLHVPDTGDVRADLLFVVEQAHRFLTETKAGEVLPRMVGEVASGTPLGRAYFDKVMRPRLQAIVGALEAAKARGEVRADLDNHLALASVIGSMMFLRLTRTLPESRGFADRLVSQLIEGMGT